MIKDEAEGSTYPRVTLADVEANIAEKYFTTGRNATYTDYMIKGDHALDTITICMLVLRNGFVIVAHSAPASPENFDAELGRKIAYENALRQIWPLMGYALKGRLAERREFDGR